MEFAIKTLILIVLAVIALVIFVAILAQSASGGKSLIDSLLEYFRGIIPGGASPAPQPSGENPVFPRIG